LTTFSFENLPIRVITINDEPWFIAADVCSALGLDQPTRALSRLDEDEKQVIDSQALTSIKGLQNNNLTQDSYNLVNESGLYSLTLGSRKPEAKKFKKWVTSEVLPSIRKTGQYQVPGFRLEPDANTSPVSVLPRSRAIKETFQVANAALAFLRKCKMFSEEDCVIGANNAAYHVANISVSTITNHPALVAPVQETTLIPTSIGKLLGVGPKPVNIALIAAGLQVPNSDSGYKLTEEGKRYGMYVYTQKSHNRGTPVEQIKWYETVVDVVKKYLPTKKAKVITVNSRAETIQ
jgi:prophage antirepressor-like protein